MPKMNGKQCLEQIKSDVNLSSIPVVVYTTSKTEADLAEAKKLGAVYFLTKPSGFSELKKAIRFIIENKISNASGLE